MNSSKALVLVAMFAAALWFSAPAAPVAASLPASVQPVWDLDHAYRESTPTRERVCLNGLWMWQPGDGVVTNVPQSGWGYFKAPGCWPGITDYMQKDCQAVYRHPDWAERKLGEIGAAWYQREITVPTNWTGRQVSLSIEYLNSYAAVYVNGQRAGELRFPGGTPASAGSGDLDLTSYCQPGTTNTLSLFVMALPLKGVMLSYTDTASAREVKGSVPRRGLCGDVYLVSTRKRTSLGEVWAETTVRNQECTFHADLKQLAPDTSYYLRARISGAARAEFTSKPFGLGDLKAGAISFTEKWKADHLWDTDTPKNVCTLEISLLDGQQNVLDMAFPVRFGFREFWIDGRDFYLNGTRLYLSAVPLDNAQVSAASATYESARETLERLQSFGINFVYTHNYDCLPGSHLGFEEILRAADDAGMLVALSQPHFSHYDWQGAEADQTNGYARLAQFYVRVARNHPSVVMYSMSHNATGYEEDMNPDMIDGVTAPRDQWSLRNAAQALRAEALVRKLDPTRIVYHHSSGNLGSMHTVNFYPNFAPVQELSDWFEHWATQGVKPFFSCEYGAPFTWDWTMYRGWYKGQREWGSARVPWEFCLAEWNAQFVGDRAYQISEAEKANLRWEAKQFQAGKVWHRWDYPNQVGSSRFEERYPIFEKYLTDNWRAFRTWGVSAISPWEFEHFWKLRPGVDKSRRELKVDWAALQRPGFSPDFVAEQYERMDIAYERSDWIPSLAAQALQRNNRPLLAYIAGKPARFTSQDHNFLPGEKVEKQLVIINNSRQPVIAECQWSVNLPSPISGKKSIPVAAGAQERWTLAFALPGELAPGTYQLDAGARFNTGETQTDRFSLNVLSPAVSTRLAGRIGVYDPSGQSRELLRTTGLQVETVEANTDISPFDLLIIGKSALTLDGQAPSLDRVRDGLKVLLFEQTAEVLEKRLGFRTAEYGLRQVFARVPDHPCLTGLGSNELRDWRGEATLNSPRLKYEMRPRYGPTVQWCGLPVPRLWRCGNRGNVASVLIEKPARGDFLPILDGGYSLQYSPLLEYREGKGVILFCQADVTGRTENEPAAERLVANILHYLVNWHAAPRREAVYVGDDQGRNYLKALGLPVSDLPKGNLSPGQVLVLGPGAGPPPESSLISRWLESGGQLVTFGLDQDQLRGWPPFSVSTTKQEHIAACFAPPSVNSLLAGVSPADVHNSDPREVPLITGGAQNLGDGVLAQADKAKAVFCQLAPWQFERTNQMNLKRTYRRTAFLLSRLLANMGVAPSTPLLDRIRQPVTAAEKRWLDGVYADQPEEWDDPYRFFRW